MYEVLFRKFTSIILPIIYRNQTKITEKKEVPALIIESRKSYQLYTRYLSIIIGETI